MNVQVVLLYSYVASDKLITSCMHECMLWIVAHFGIDLQSTKDLMMLVLLSLLK